MKLTNSTTTLLTLLFSVFLITCNGEANKQTASASDKEVTSAEENPDGIGPVKELILPPTIDEELAQRGGEIFLNKCSACHKTDKRFIGPNPTGILERRTPAWVMNMILNPEEMVQKDPVARQLLIEYNGAPMANQNLTEEEARAVLEYFRTL
ncbi:MAG: cytochrome c [Balneolales bacterium]|nr:cytochrome c [Balneolales bacterium]